MLDVIRRFDGVIPSPPDRRDYTLSRVATIGSRVYPDSHEVWMTPEVLDQGGTGSCVAHAMAIALACLMHKVYGFYYIPSVGMIYGNRAPTDYQGVGMQPRQACDGVTKTGDVLRTVFESPSEVPEIINLVLSKMPDLLPQIAIKPKAYVRLEGEYAIKDYMLDYGLPALITIPLMGGYHEILAYKWYKRYDGVTNYITRNSWGGTGNIGFDTPQSEITEAWGLIPMEAENIDFLDIYKEGTKDKLWYTDAILELARREIMNGYPQKDGETLPRFKPLELVNRAQLAVALDNLLRKLGL